MKLRNRRLRVRWLNLNDWNEDRRFLRASRSHIPITDQHVLDRYRIADLSKARHALRNVQGEDFYESDQLREGIGVPVRVRGRKGDCHDRARRQNHCAMEDPDRLN